MKIVERIGIFFQVVLIGDFFMFSFDGIEIQMQKRILCFFMSIQCVGKNFKHQADEFFLR